ncbi:hypothetical protein JW933_10085, partial [candidate division FCPU426 bacterium]|nr:hypothetical protein [candidate division FCPU426 bacterium]
WRLTAPRESGLYPAVIQQAGGKDCMQLNIFVMVPFQRLGKGGLHGYRIGAYPRASAPALSLPRGFVKVTAQNASTRISPHFTLGQFVCKQKSAFPHYLVLDTTLVFKLEKILDRLNEQGYGCRQLRIMSGYRTPYYNRRLGNVRFSSHVWGRAADVYVDEDQDGNMDDLNQDGRHDHEDAAILCRIADAIDCSTRNKKMVGGLGLYPATPHHGPFAHIDVRGQKARWGIAFQRSGVPEQARKQDAQADGGQNN